jgi:hypothetical protein
MRSASVRDPPRVRIMSELHQHSIAVLDDCAPWMVATVDDQLPERRSPHLLDASHPWGEGPFRSASRARRISMSLSIASASSCMKTMFFLFRLGAVRSRRRPHRPEGLARGQPIARSVPSRRGLRRRGRLDRGGEFRGFRLGQWTSTHSVAFGSGVWDGAAVERDVPDGTELRRRVRGRPQA